MRLSDPTGQKRKEVEVMTENQSRAKAKAADPAGSTRKPSEVAEGTQSPVKAKMAEPTGEKRKADGDAEEELQGSPMRSRVEDNEIDLAASQHSKCYNYTQGQALQEIRRSTVYTQWIWGA